MQHPSSHSRQPLTWKTIAIVTSSVVFAFVLGIGTAGELLPVVGPTRAGDAVLLGDLNNNGTVDIADAQIALELAQGYRTPTPSELKADPNGDYHCTLEDVAAILRILAAAPLEPSVEL